jgi:nicotinamidase-related amidase
MTMTAPRRALIVVDVQQEYFGGALEIQYPAHSSSLQRITDSIDAATAAGIPVVVVQHSAGDEAPVFNPTTEAFSLHPEIERRRSSGWKAVTKRYSSVFADTDLLDWVREKEVDTITLVGYMTNNCIIASAAAAEPLELQVEVLSDATGAISIANAAGMVDGETVHTTLMALLQSNFAAVETTSSWVAAVSDGSPLAKDNLPTSAVAGAKHFALVEPRG